MPDGIESEYVRALYRVYDGRIRAVIAAKLGGGYAAAPAVAHAVWREVMRRQGALPAPAGVYEWLLGVARAEIVAYHRLTKLGVPA